MPVPGEAHPADDLNALAGKPLPVYGDGQNVRDWLYVDDHCRALRAVLARGRAGETYNIGGNAERTNLDVVRTLCAVLLDEPRPAATSIADHLRRRPPGARPPLRDRPGKIRRELGWTPAETFAIGHAPDGRWYLDNAAWLRASRPGTTRSWIKLQYAPSPTSAGA